MIETTSDGSGRRDPIAAVPPVSPTARRIRRFLLQRCWPLLAAGARLYRKTLAARKPVVVTVGSLGKTTTTAAVNAVLGLPNARMGNGFAGPAASLLGSAPGRSPLALEVGIGRKGQMIRHARALCPDIVVFTSIAREHWRSLGDLEQIREEKALIFAHMREGGTAVLNGDDPLVRDLADRVPGRVVTYGFGGDNAVRVLDHRLDWPNGAMATVDLFGERLEIRTRLLGRVALYPLLAALAVGHTLGRDGAEMRAGLAGLVPRPGRLRLLSLPQGAWLIDDTHKGNLETVEAALDLLEEIPARRLVVMGEIHEPPGSLGPLLRALGARLAAIADRVVTLGSRKSWTSLRAGARRVGLSPEVFLHAGHDWRNAAEMVGREIRPGDVVLVKGRDRQRLMRLSLALSGRKVRCVLADCTRPVPGCHACPRL